MKKSIIIISSILLVAFLAGSSFAWGPGSGQGMKGSGSNQDCPRYGGQGSGKAMINDLSQEQKDKLTALRQQFVDETYELRSAKFTKRQEMKMLMETSNPDRAKLGKLSQEMTDLQKQLRDRQIDFRLSAKEIAPELGKGMGFRQGCSNCPGQGGQKGNRGQGQRGNQGGNQYQNN